MSKETYGLSTQANTGDSDAPLLPYQPRDPNEYRPNIALIGCGGIAEHHLKAYTKANYRVVALCDVNRDSAERRRAEFYPDAEVFTDYSDVLKRDNIEVVDVLAHPHQRPPILEAALRARKHVLSQKPFVLDLDEGEHLADLADEMNVRLAVNQNGRWAPHFAYAREAIRAGLLGEVLGAHLHVSFNHIWAAEGTFKDVYDLVLYDFGIHWFDIVTTFMGGARAKRVFGSIAHGHGQTQWAPLLAQCLIEYENAQATLSFDAMTRYGGIDATFLAGTRGSIRSSGPSLAEQTLTLETVEGRSTPELTGTWFPDGFHGAMGELLCAVEENRAPSNNARDNLKSLELAFAAIASSHDNTPKRPGEVRQVPPPPSPSR